jgi:hypothetical protein
MSWLSYKKRVDENGRLLACRPVIVFCKYGNGMLEVSQLFGLPDISRCGLISIVGRVAVKK